MHRVWEYLGRRDELCLKALNGYIEAMMFEWFARVTVKEGTSWHREHHTQSLVVLLACPLTARNWHFGNHAGRWGRRRGSLPEAVLGHPSSTISPGQMVRGAEPCYSQGFPNSPFQFHQTTIYLLNKTSWLLKETYLLGLNCHGQNGCLLPTCQTLGNLCLIITFFNSQKIHPINSKLNAYLQNSNSQRNQIISFQPVSDGYMLVKESQLMSETIFFYPHAVATWTRGQFFHPLPPLFVSSLISFLYYRHLESAYG